MITGNKSRLNSTRISLVIFVHGPSLFGLGLIPLEHLVRYDLGMWVDETATEAAVRTVM